MAWTTPNTWVVGAILTAAQLNTHLRDNTRYLYGLDGEIVLGDYPDFPSTAQGDVFYHDGTKLARLAAGTSGYFLKTQGAAANPAWAAESVNLTFNTTKVFNSTAPTTWTDLDLSATVGADQVVACLRVRNNAAGSVNYYFRRNGETLATGVEGSTAFILTQDQIMYAIVPTDTAGVIEWLASAGNATIVNMEYYIN